MITIFAIIKVRLCHEKHDRLGLSNALFNLSVMDKRDILNRIEYVVCCVGAFASRFNLTNAQAYAYLRRFTGIDFLLDCYAAEHTLSIDDAVEDLIHICLQKGGQIA